MMVFDTSAFIGIIKQEPGHLLAEHHLPTAVASAVNMAEVATWLARQGTANDAIDEALAAFTVEVIPFGLPLAVMAGGLQRDFKRFGLSLGDRACIATAMQRNLPVLTTDRIWKEAGLPVEVVLLRG